MLVCGQEFSEGIIGRIRAEVGVNPGLTRRRLSLQVCEWLKWKSPNGKPKEMSCRVALLKLERQGILKQPAPQAWGGLQTASRKLQSTGWKIDRVACSLAELGVIELVRIDSPQTSLSQIWNGLMRTYHYLGAGPLCGAQVRYLIKSEQYGWLGGLAFSGAAWRLEARDKWIGWDEESRRDNLKRVVCNSRFLIPSQVQVPNLASHVLALAARRLGRDWNQRYGLIPLLLETFVDKERFTGTSYQAANWLKVGETKGRGRQDRQRDKLKQVKDIYVYPLVKAVREALCSSISVSQVKLKVRPPGPVLDWAEEELGRADLGDRRLEKRLVSLLRDFYNRPQASIPEACRSRAKTKAAYRFLEHPEMTMDKVLAAHYEATIERIKKEKIVLTVQDTTTLNYTTHPATEGLGLIGYRKTGGLGLILHDTLAFDPEGVALGLVNAQCWARDEADYGKKKRRKELPIEQKESNKWLVSYQKTVEVQKRCPGATLVSVGDREADIYELFELALRESNALGAKLLVRASHDRILGEGQGHLWQKLAEQAVSGIQEVRIPRRVNRPSRVARLEVRFAQISLKPPPLKAGMPVLSVWGVLAREVDAPADIEPIEWLLLTTLEVTTFEQAVEKIRWYTLRWSIEVYHRTLKSGCKIEERQLGTADRIETCLGIDMLVAWRIMHLTKLGRETPDVPCTVYFEEAEWKALAAYLTRNPVPPQKTPTLREAVRMVATLGGFIGRKGDGEPGAQTLWIGLAHLEGITAMYKIMTSKDVPHLKKHVVSSNPEYG
jgi:hypothetical protein